MLPDNILTIIKVPSTDLWGRDKGKNARVDIYISKAIQILNDKGYKTRCCCSGHYKYDSDGVLDTQMQGYIWFEDYVESAPNGWYIDDYKMSLGGDCIRYEAKKSKTILRKKMAKLMRWAKSLPVKEN